MTNDTSQGFNQNVQHYETIVQNNKLILTDEHFKSNYHKRYNTIILLTLKTDFIILSLYYDYSN